MTASTRSPLETVAALRPQHRELDPAWAEPTLRRIVSTDPDASAPRAGRRSTALSTRLAIGVTGLALAGGGVAAAAGVGPDDFTRAFAGWGTQSPGSDGGLGAQPVDPASAERVAVAPGPGATSFTLVAAEGEDGFTCVAALFETAESVRQPAPTHFLDANGSICDTLPADARFGDLAATDVLREPEALGQAEVSVISLAAGDATRLELTTRDGETHPVRLVDGRFYSWFAGEPSGRVVATGYDDSGRRVGRTTF